MTRYDNRYARLVANQKPAPDQLETGCWLWTKRTTRGYGRINVWDADKQRAVPQYAHRELEQLLRTADAQRTADDAIPDAFILADTVEPVVLTYDETTDHQCWCRGCLCPDHWTVVTRAKNTSNMRTRK